MRVGKKTLRLFAEGEFDFSVGLIQNDAVRFFVSRHSVDDDESNETLHLLDAGKFGADGDTDGQTGFSGADDAAGKGDDISFPHGKSLLQAAEGGAASILPSFRRRATTGSGENRQNMKINICAPEIGPPLESDRTNMRIFTEFD